MGLEPDSLLACVHCGLCLPACPTFRALGDENDSPRGRLYLMKAAADGRLASDSALRLHLSRCLGCRACETVCPAGVPYGALLEESRTALAEGRPLPAALSRALLWALAGPPARPLYALLRGLRRWRVPAAAGRLLPGRAGLAARMLAASAPAPPRRRALDGAPEVGAAGAARRDAAADVPAGAAADADPEGDGPRWWLLEGCVMRGLFGHVQRATRRALAARGWREASSGGSGCCGALHAHAGHREGAQRLARRTIAAFEASGAEWAVTDSAGCGAALREYEDWLAGDPEWGERAAAFSARVLDVSEAIAGPRKSISGNPRAELPAAESSATRNPGIGRSGDRRADLRIAYDAPCHLLHAQEVDRSPLRMLAAQPGVSAEALPSAADCCGGAGTYGLLRLRLARAVLAGKLDEIQAGGYDAVVTGNPGCIMQIGAGLRARADRTPVLHPVELLTPPESPHG